MFTIHAKNVNHAFAHGLNLLHEWGEGENSRAGPVWVCPFPIITVYERPWERVLFHPQRDANPFFHLFESIWMLAGQRNARWLDQFVSDFSSRFAEEGGEQHGAYGYRWLHHFDPEGGEEIARLPNQLNTIVEMLRKNPNDRRTVLTMWDPVADLAVDKRDIPCNTHVYFRLHGGALDITVCCRSNDAIWGAYGANSVHFSVLQEYIARELEVKMGKYYQVSNNFHAYEGVLNKYTFPVETIDFYPETKPTPIVTNPGFLKDASTFIFRSGREYEFINPGLYSNPFFTTIAAPLLSAHRLWKQTLRAHALAAVRELPLCDWRVAAEQWMVRRINAYPGRSDDPAKG